MNSGIKIISSGKIEEDYGAFINAAVKKYNIKNKEAFDRDMKIFIKKNMKEEYIENRNDEEYLKEKKEEFENIAAELIDLIDKHSKGFDFYEGAEEEVQLMKKTIEARRNG